MPPVSDTRPPTAPTPVAQFGASTRDVVRCRVCGRTLLMGERSIGCFTKSGEGPFDVCELCVPQAGRFGLRPQPSTPDEVVREQQRRTRRLRLRLPRLRRRRAAAREDAIAAAPIGVAAIPVALASFNESEHARTLAGLSRTLGAPRASVVPRSPLDREVILTVAWEIVWYQFRIMPDGGIEADRGTYLSDLPVRWQQWNCAVRASGQVTPPTADRSAVADAPLAPRDETDHAAEGAADLPGADR